MALEDTTDSGIYDAASRKRKIAEMLLGQSFKPEPIQHWTQGLAEMARAGLGGYLFNKADEEDKASDQSLLDTYLPKQNSSVSGVTSALTAPPSNQQSSISPDDRSIPASIRTNNPGAQWPGQVSSQFGSTGSQTIGGNNKIAMFADPTQGAAAQFGLLAKNYAGMPLSQAIQKWSGGNSSPQYTQAVAQATGLDPNTPLTPEFLKNPEVAIPLAKAMAKQEAGRDYPMTDEQWQQAHQMAFGGGQQPQQVASLDPSAGLQAPSTTTNTVTTGSPVAQALNAPAQPPNQTVAQTLQGTPQPPPQSAPPQQQGGLLQGLSPQDAEYLRKNPQQARKLIPDLIQKQMEGRVKGSDPTDDIKEYNKSKEQGYEGTFHDYMLEMKRAGAINIDQRGDNAYEKTINENFAKKNIEIADAAQQARGKIGTLDRMSQLLNDPNVYTGKGGSSVLELKRIGKALGISDKDMGGDGVGSSEALQAIGNQFALEMRNPAGGAGMPGAMSDKDREFLQAIVPGLGQNPEGNKKIIDYMKRVANRSLEVDKLRRQYVKKNGKFDDGFYDELANWSDQNPLFPEADQKQVSTDQPNSPPVGLPQGAKQAKDGNYYVPDPQRPGKYLQVVQ